MQRLYQFIGEQRAYIALGLAVVVSLGLMTLGYSEKLGLARSATTFLLKTGHGVFSWPMGLADLRYKNKVLREQNLRLSMELVGLRESKLENQRLLGLLNFKRTNREAGDYLVAKVIARDPDRITNTVVIGIGQTDGVTERMPVVTADGLVGRVLEVHGGTSIVQLLLDRNCRVSAIIQRHPRTQGIVMSENETFYLRHVPLRSEVEVDDVVVSSGLGDIFPGGLMVGTVTALGDEEQGLFREVVLTPGVNFANLEEVFVLKKRAAESVP
jgi:rod shape-determining protein MreC